MERDQHLVQDTAERYAVFIMQQEAERLGVAGSMSSQHRRNDFESYLTACGLQPDDFESGLYGKYKANVDAQLPRFVARLANHFAGASLDFRDDEAAMRVLGKKGDFLIRVSDRPDEIPVSLKNYTGGGGITRPQVSSGTFLSFACGFVFDRIGVGQYADPRFQGGTFRGQDGVARNAVLAYQKRDALIEPLAHLEQLQQDMRADLLAPDALMYDKKRVRAAVDRIAQPGITSVLQIFELLGIDVVRNKFLARIGLDGTEESLFFDSERYLDSITDRNYHDLRERLNGDDTVFTAAPHRQGIRFAFHRGSALLLKADVPFTINTNGAWFRPKVKYAGTQVYVDKGHNVELEWGQRRPYKSMEIATSTNTYLDLARVGLFGK